MKKTKIALLSLFVAIISVCSVMFFAACGGEKEPEVETYALTWVLPDGVTVSVEGASELPSTWEKDQGIAFTLTLPEGYNAVVKTNTTLSPNKDGKYSISKISRDTTVTVTLEEKVTAVKVEKEAGFDAIKYFAGDEVDKTTIKVTVTYAITGDKVLESGYTVNYPNDSVFVIGDESFTVSYRGATSSAIELGYAVEGKEFGFTSVDIEIEDGKPYYILRGTYSNYDEEKFGQIGFDFQEQGFYSQAQGGSAGWAYVLYQTEMTEFKGGVFTLKVDMSNLVANLESTGLPSMLFNPHMGFNPPGDNSGNKDIKPTEDNPINFENGKAIELNGVEYKIHHEAYVNGGDNSTTSFDMVGILITNKNAKFIKFVNASLKDDGGKPYLVLNGSGAETEEEILTRIGFLDLQDISHSYATLNFVDGDEVVDGADVKIKLDKENGTFEVWLLIEGTAVIDGANFFAHLGSKVDNSGNHPNLSLAIDADNKTITCGDFVYTLNSAADAEVTESWASGLLFVSVRAKA